MQNRVIRVFGGPRLLAVGAVLWSLCPGLTAAANPPAAGSPPSELSQIVVQARKIPVTLPDEIVTQQIESAIRANRYLNADHVTIQTRNGVVHLQGLIQDEWDLRQLQRLVRRIGSVRRVVNDLDLDTGGSD
jgi:hypothetical protein